MKSLIKKILKESTDDRTSFMGMRLDRLKTLQPTNYLVKSLKAKEEALKNREMGLRSTEMVDEIISEYDSVYENIKELLTYLDYNDISFKKVMQPRMPVFYVKLPKNINDEFRKLKKIKSRLDTLINQLKADVDSDALEPSKMLKDWVQLFDTLGVYLYLDPGNRTHFPIGLPKSFQGYNLGYKIYRRILNTLTYMQSSANATNEVQNIYRTLLKENDVNCVIIENSVLLLKKEMSINKKMSVIYDFIYNSYLSLRKKEPYMVNKDVILDSDLSKSIGQRNIKDIFQNSFDEYREYYKKIPKKTYGYSVNESVLAEVGFKPSYMNPDINVIINFDAPDADKDLNPILVDFLVGKSVKVNSISVGTGVHKSCRLDLNFYNKRDIQHLINDLNTCLMVIHNVRIIDVKYYIK